MRAQRAAFIVVCGVAAATGAGVWVLWSSEPEVLPVERTALAQAPKPAEPVAPELPPPGATPGGRPPPRPSAAPPRPSGPPRKSPASAGVGATEATAAPRPARP